MYERDTETGKVHFHEVTQTEVERVGTVIVVRDVTRRVEAQRTQDQLNLELGAAQKSQAVSTLAASLAHDFNNLSYKWLGATDRHGERRRPHDRPTRQTHFIGGQPSLFFGQSNAHLGPRNRNAQCI